MIFFRKETIRRFLCECPVTRNDVQAVFCRTHYFFVSAIKGRFWMIWLELIGLIKVAKSQNIFSILSSKKKKEQNQCLSTFLFTYLANNNFVNLRCKTILKILSQTQSPLTHAWPTFTHMKFTSFDKMAAQSKNLSLSFTITCVQYVSIYLFICTIQYLFM